MFSTLYRFFDKIRFRATDMKLTLVMCRDDEFASMSRADLIRMRAACYDLAEAITAYVTAQDVRDIDHDERD